LSLKISTMKTTIYLLAILFAQSTLAQSIVKSQLSEITLYLDGAKILRTSNIALKKGEQKIVITDISNKIEDNSVRISTDANVKILSVNTRQNFITPSVDGNSFQDLKDSVSYLKFENQDINDELNAYASQRELLSTNQKVNNSEGFSPAQLKEYADFYLERVLTLNKKITKLNREIETNNYRITKYQNHINVNRNTKTISKKEIVVVFKSSASKTALVNIEYLVSSAGWVPTYDIRVDDITKPMMLDYKAQVYNNTGVNWSNVAFKLSTADPRKSASRPEMGAWVIKNNSYNKNNDDLSQSNRESERKSQIDKDGITYEEISIPELTTEFEIKERYNIPSDAKPYLIEVTNYELKATYKHYAIPKIEKAVFLLARITGWEDLNLIEGDANIYFANNYIGKSYINTAKVQDTLDVSLGRDSKVVIDRIKTKDYADTKMIGNSKKDYLDFEITVKNLRDTPIQIEILDQVPISGDDEIVIETLETTKAIENEKSGKLSWNYRLESGQSEKITLGFSIKYPKNMSYAKQKHYKSVRAKF
jgi:uncharacterized protein (TIGR02231 family)